MLRLCKYLVYFIISLFIYIKLSINVQADTINSYSLTIDQNSAISFPLLDKGNSYYLQQDTDQVFPGSSSASRFCDLIQPTYNIKYYDSVHDQTNATLLLNQNHILSVNNILYVLSDDATLRAFKMTFQDVTNVSSTIVDLNHINEIYLTADGLQNELASHSYVKLLYLDAEQMLLIVSKSVVYALSLNEEDFLSWMDPIKVSLINEDMIVRADVFQYKLYILRGYNYLEVWNLEDVNNISRISNIDLTQQVSGFKLGSSINITDFDVNNGYLAIIEKNSKKLLIFDDESLSSDFSQNLIYNGNFDNEPLYLFLFENKLVVLVDGAPNFKYSLEEYELFADKSIFFLRMTNFNEDLNDIVIGDIYVVASFATHLDVFPHIFVDPVNTPNLMKYRESAQGIDNIEYFQMLGASIKQNKTEYFTVMKGGVITIMKVEEAPGRMNCIPTTDVQPGVYYNDILFYEVDCQDLNQYCNTSIINKNHQSVTIIVQKNNNLVYIQGDSQLGTYLVIVFVCGLVLGTVITMSYCCVQIRKIKSRYEKPEEAKPKPERIMSQDELFPQKSNIRSDLNV